MPTHYDAFISYSHSADGKLAPAVQNGLQRLARPWNSARALKIFRDDTGLSVNPHLWSSIQEALEHSRYFVLMASPDAARSEWVNREIESWLSEMPGDRILPVLTDGDLVWDEARNDFDHGASTGVPPALFGRLTEEPRYLDLRWARDNTQLTIRNARFRDAIADLAAPMHGVSKDELQSEDVRQYRRRIHLARAAGALVAILAVVAVVAAIFALQSASDARAQTQVARSRQLAAGAISVLGTRPDTSLLLAAEAERVDDNDAARETLLRVAEAQPAGLRRILRLPASAASVTAIGASGDGRTIAARGTDGSVTLFDLATGRTLRSPPKGEVIHPAPGTISLCDAPAPVLSQDAALVAECGKLQPGWIWNRRTGRRTRFGAEVPLAFSPDGSTLAVTNGSSVQMVSTRTGRSVWSQPGSATAASFDPSGRLVAFAVPSAGSAGEEAWVADATTGARIVGPLAWHLAAFGARLSVRFGGTDAARTLVASAIAPGSRVTGVIGLTSATEANATPNAGSTATWSIPSGTQLTVQALPATLAGADPIVARSADGARVVTQGSAGSLQQWDVASGTRVGGPVAGQRSGAVAFAGTGSAARLLVSGSDAVIRVFAIADTLPPIAHELLSADASQPAGIALAADGSVLAKATAPFDHISLYDARNGKTDGTVATGPQPTAILGPSVGIAVSPDGRRVATYANGALKVWDARTGKAVAEVPTTFGNVAVKDQMVLPEFFALSPDGRTLALVGLAVFNTGAGNNIVGSTGFAVVDLRTRRVRLGSPGSESSVSAPTFSPDGRLVAVAYPDIATTVFYDAHSARVRGRLTTGAAAGAGTLTFLPDGTLLTATSSALDRAAGPGHAAPATPSIATDLQQPTVLAVSGDGRTAVAGRTQGSTVVIGSPPDQSLRLFDLTTGRQLADPLPGPVPAAVALDRTGNVVFGVTGAGELVRWDLRVETLLHIVCGIAGDRGFTSAESATYLSGFATDAPEPCQGH